MTMQKKVMACLIVVASAFLSGCFKGEPDKNRVIAEIQDFYDVYDPDFEPVDDAYRFSDWHEDVQGHLFVVVHHSAYLLRSEKEIRARNLSHLGALNRLALHLEHPPKAQVGDKVTIKFRATFVYNGIDWVFSHLNHSVYY